ncbi:MAG: hypothetical protein AAGG81_07790 [Chlamydiota bacterium]
MAKKEQLTIETFRKKYDSQFDLVNHAIGLAVNLITTGRAPRVKIKSQNPAAQVLAEIREGKDTYVIIDGDSAEGEVDKDFGAFKTSDIEE